MLRAGLLIAAGWAGVAASAPDRGLGRVAIVDAAGVEVGWYDASYALLVGVSEYDDPAWPDLEAIPRELDRVERALRRQGFEIVRVADATGEGLDAAFKDFIGEHGVGAGSENNRLLFFFAGHGFTRRQGSRGYLVGSDAPDPRQDEKGFLKRSLPLKRVVDMAGEIEAKHALFLFDSCFSGTVFSTRALPDLPPDISAYTAEPVRQFLTAGSADETVPAESVFTPLFVRALEGEADLDGDGYVTGTELGIRIKKQVPLYDPGQTPQFGKIRDVRLDRGDFVFRVLDAGPTAAPAGREPAAPASAAAGSRPPPRAVAPPLAEELRRLNPPVFIAGGEFPMGSPEGVGEEFERPRHRVRVSSFWIQRYEVTNEEYRRFDPGHEFARGLERHPVTEVDWAEAQAYAESLGGSLPTEAQWEFAARGPEGRTYPWGEAEPTCRRANFRECGSRRKPVGSHPAGATPEGVEDLAGNVWEWCRDWNGVYSAAAQEDPVGPATGTSHLLRGGSFYYGTESLRATFRGLNPPEARFDDLGFRVAWPAVEEGGPAPDGGRPAATPDPPAGTARGGV